MCITIVYWGVESFLSIIPRERLVISFFWSSSDQWTSVVHITSRRFMLLSYLCSYLVDPASSHRLVLKIKPCMSKCFVLLTLDCGRLIITVIVLLRLLYRWTPVVILELIHLTKNIFFYILSIYFSSNQYALALWMIQSNVRRTL